MLRRPDGATVVVGPLRSPFEQTEWGSGPVLGSAGRRRGGRACLRARSPRRYSGEVLRPREAPFSAQHAVPVPRLRNPSRDATPNPISSGCHSASRNALTPCAGTHRHTADSSSLRRGVILLDRARPARAREPLPAPVVVGSSSGRTPADRSLPPCRSSSRDVRTFRVRSFPSVVWGSSGMTPRARAATVPSWQRRSLRPTSHRPRPLRGSRPALGSPGTTRWPPHRPMTRSPRRCGGVVRSARCRTVTAG